MKRIKIISNIKGRTMDMSFDDYLAGDFKDCEVIKEYESNVNSKKKSKKKTYSDKKVNEYDSNEF